MKKFLIVLILFLIAGCTNRINPYECQIQQIVSNQAPCNELVGQRIHICEIKDADYKTSQGIPNYCKTTCLQKSSYLNDYPAECVVVKVAYTEEYLLESNAMERQISEVGEVYASDLE